MEVFYTSISDTTQVSDLAHMHVTCFIFLVFFRPELESVTHIKFVTPAINKTKFQFKVLAAPVLTEVLGSLISDCRGPAPVDPGKFEGETASANTLALIKY